VLDTAALWDAALEEHAAGWRAARYHAVDNNCYSFVVGFLNARAVFEGRSDHTKLSIASDLLGPQIDQLEAYISLWRRLQSQSFVTLDIPDGVLAPGAVRHSCDACQ
jgi:hypothetical protein